MLSDKVAILSLSGLAVLVPVPLNMVPDSFRLVYPLHAGVRLTGRGG